MAPSWNVERKMRHAFALKHGFTVHSNEVEWDVDIESRISFTWIYYIKGNKFKLRYWYATGMITRYHYEDGLEVEDDEEE
ncbi:hypothetical protein D3C73_1449270 [compost metagenome]